MPAKNIIEFILYITPGFIALEFYHAFYPVKERSDFVQIAWSIIYGVIIFSLVRWVDENLLNYALNSNKLGFPDFRFIIILLGTGLVVSGFMILIHIIRFKLSIISPKISKIAPDPYSIWAKVNQPSNKDWAVVFLDDGSIYIGWISKYKFDPNIENQDFLLTRAKRVGGDLKEKYIVDGIGVYLNTKDVKRIEFVKGVNKE